MRLILLLILFSPCVFSQTTAPVGVSITMPSVALFDIEPNNTGFTLNFSAPTDAGNGGISTTNNSKWLNFTSAVVSGSTRSISAQISGTMPSGLNLRLVTGNYVGSGAGALGSPVSPLNLTTSQQTIIDNIGGAYTGNGSSNGYNLSFSLVISDYSLIRSQSATLTIIYTLIDN
jgi:hypothetical protein